MPEHLSRRELVTGAAALMLGEKLAVAEVSAQKKTYPVEMADKRVVPITISYEARTRTIVASPDNGSARLNMDDTLIISSHEPFVLQFIPLNGGPPHPFLSWPKGQPENPAIFRGTRFEATVKSFETLPLPFYSYTIQVADRVLDPWIIVDGRVANPWICAGGRCST